jgi:hypothetical protein
MHWHKNSCSPIKRIIKKMQDRLDKVEMLKWLGTSSSFMRPPSEESATKLNDLELRLSELEKRCAFLSELLVDEYTSRHVHSLSSKSSISKETQETLINGVSSNRVNEFVEQLLSQSTTNFGWIPDALERRIDRRILHLVLGLISQTLTTAAVKIGDGHELTFSLQPQETTQSSVSPSSDTTSPQQPVGSGNLDLVIFTALKSILDTVKVEFMGHNLQFHLK